MSSRAWAYIWLVYLITAVALAEAVLLFPLGWDAWPTAGALTLLATLAQLFKVNAPRNQTYYATAIFLFAGVLLLSPALFALLVIVSYLVEWGKERIIGSPLLRKWYLQPFNICAHILAGYTAKVVYTFVANTSPVPSSGFLTLESVLGIGAGVITYVVINHGLIGAAYVLAHNTSWRDSNVADTESLLAESVLLAMGGVTAVVWTVNPWLLIPALAPLVLVYRSLKIPQLKHDAQIDAKTGLHNAKHFATCFAAELDRSRRFSRPLSLIVADLDLLRNVNNTYGHLAGDRVLAEVGRVIRSTIREYDIAGRFGGEEFTVALPEVDQDAARIIGERLRHAIEHTDIEITNKGVPINITISLGIASLTPGVSSAEEMLHAADVALYQAKLQGRNKVVCIEDVPHSLELDKMNAADYQFISKPLAPNNLTAGLRDDRNEATVITRPLPLMDSHRANIAHAPAQPASPVAAHPEANTGQAQPLTTGPIASPDAQAGSQRLLALFVGVVIVAGLAAVALDLIYVAARGGYFFTTNDLVMLGILIVLAMLAEYFQITLYGPDTLSVSMALNFAAAPILGIPGVMAVSLTIALVHYVRRRPLLYKTAFNWSTHLLAGLPAVFLLAVPHDVPLMNRIVVLLAAALLAATAYFIIDTGMVATAIALAGRENVVQVWRERFQWLAGHYVALGVTGLFISLAYFALGPFSVLAFMVPIAMMRYAQKQYVDRTESSVRELKRMNAELTFANREVMLANLAMQDLNEELFLTLSKIIDARDPYVGGHAAKVADYAIAIARELRMPEERLEALRQAGFLHDIGKIGISEQVLHKPSKLTDEEYEYVKKHAALGGEFLETSRALRHLSPFVRHHHERWDGKGYPDALSADEIELEARILAVCDAAEAMASDRPYRKGMSLDEMVEEIKRCAGTQFDPDVAAAFVKIVARERDRLITNSAQEVMKRYPDNTILSPLTSGAKPPRTQRREHTRKDDSARTTDDLAALAIGRPGHQG
jgi:diguanylate cyclase (GGDEF)-like protein